MEDCGRREDAVSAFCRRALWLFCALAAAIMIWGSGRGFGFGDEGVYLLCISTPANCSDTLSDFGFVWHPVYALLQGDLRALRLAGIAVTVGCATGFGFALTHWARARLTGAATGLIAALALSVLWQFGHWAWVTPNYNQLNLCGALLILWGLLTASVPAGQKSADGALWRHAIAPAALSAVGLVLCALSKPTTAVAMALLGLAWIALIPMRRRWIYFLVTAGLALLFLAAAVTVMDGSVTAFVQRKYSAYSIWSSLGYGHSTSLLPRLSRYPLSVQLVALLMAIGACATLTAMIGLFAGGLKNFSRPRLVAAAIFALILAALIACSTLLMGPAAASDHPAFSPGYLLFLASLCLLPAIFITLLVMVQGPLRQAADDLDGRTVIVTLLVALTPLAYSFGTGAVAMYHTHGAGVLWCAAIWLAASLAPRGYRGAFMSGGALLCGLLSIAFLARTVYTPYMKLDTMWSQTQTVVVGPDHARLQVDPDTARYLTALTDSARKAGFQFSDGLLNFSVAGPASTYALGGETFGQMYLGYGMAEGGELARGQMMAQPPGVAAKAWLLMDSRDMHTVASMPWQRVGRPFPAGYNLVLTLPLPRTGVTSMLWKPN